MEERIPLDGYRVVDISSDIAGAYTSKILADGGAQVIKLEPPQGDLLRRRHLAVEPLPEGEDGALFQYLSCSKSSVVVDPAVEEDLELARTLLRAADVIVWTSGSGLAALPEFQPDSLRSLAPAAIVVALSSWGLKGPWADRPATPSTLQTWSGGPGQRGREDQPPVVAGGDLGYWMAGMFGGLGSLASLWRRETKGGGGELLDVSILESEVMTQMMYLTTFFTTAGYPWRPRRAPNIPDIHPTADGFAGFMVITGQQWLDFCTMIERPDYAEDETLFYYHNRNARREELLEAINAWTSGRTTEEAVALAAAFRIPTAPVGNGATVTEFDHFADGGFYVKNPRGGFLQPDVPYRLGNGAAHREFEQPPTLGEHTASVRASVAAGDFDRPDLADVEDDPHPPLAFAGVRIADVTSMWAGPIISHIPAMLGADVIHVETIQRPDGMRFSQLRQPGQPDWWEWSPLFQGANTNKRDLTLDLQCERGLEVFKQVLEHCDVVVENYSPRVMENFGLTYEEIAKVRPDVIMLRAPAFGLSGPWRDRVGYAQTMEQVTGLAYVTGYPDSEPQVVNGPCDPLAGTHATIALLLAMFHRHRTGKGMMLEVPMVGGALNIAAEQVVEHSAYGHTVQRLGNRHHLYAPQGMYLTADIDADDLQDRWVMISVDTDGSWRALCGALARPDLATDESLSTLAGRQAAHDVLDEVLSGWCATRSAQAVHDALVSAGVPVAIAIMPHEQMTVEQLGARGFFEEVEHPLSGTSTHITYPVRFSKGPEKFHRRHSPLLGEHNHEILKGLVGLDDEAIAELEREQVIGNSPPGATKAWGV